MLPKKNIDQIERVRTADLKGDSVESRKPLYIEQNIFDVHPDQPIYRIVQKNFFFSDVNNRRLSHTRVGPMIWGDPAENPLLEKTFIDEAGERFSLRGLVNDSFGVCWSLKPVPTQEMWSYFSNEYESIQIQSTPRKILEAVMDIQNPFYMLHHFIGQVEYVVEKEFDAEFDESNWSKYLDSLGQGIALSLLKLPDGPKDEQEVRLIYQLDRNSEWTKKNVIIRGDFVEIPFNWENVIDRVIAGPYIQPKDCLKLKRTLLECKINCPVISYYSPHQTLEC